jgi:hypothetical protein
MGAAVTAPGRGSEPLLDDLLDLRPARGSVKERALEQALHKLRAHKGSP